MDFRLRVGISTFVDAAIPCRLAAVISLATVPAGTAGGAIQRTFADPLMGCCAQHRDVGLVEATETPTLLTADAARALAATYGRHHHSRFERGPFSVRRFKMRHSGCSSRNQNVTDFVLTCLQPVVS